MRRINQNLLTKKASQPGAPFSHVNLDCGNKFYQIHKAVDVWEVAQTRYVQLQLLEALASPTVTLPNLPLL